MAERDIYYKIRQASILENAYVISKIREFLSSDEYKQGLFDGTFNEINKLIGLVGSGGLFALENYTGDNAIIREFIKLILAGTDVEIMAYMLIPKILYNDLTSVDFVKTVLLYEAVIMIYIGNFDGINYRERIDYRLKSVFR